MNFLFILIPIIFKYHSIIFNLFLISSMPSLLTLNQVKYLQHNFYLFFYFLLFFN